MTGTGGGGGRVPYETDRDTCQKIGIKLPKETNLGMAQALSRQKKFSLGKDLRDSEHCKMACFENVKNFPLQKYLTSFYLGKTKSLVTALSHSILKPECHMHVPHGECHLPWCV